jgi:hypothetical protein
MRGFCPLTRPNSGLGISVGGGGASARPHAERKSHKEMNRDLVFATSLILCDLEVLSREPLWIPPLRSFGAG